MKARRLVPPILRPVARRLYWRYVRLHPATARGVRARAKIVARYRAFAKSPIASLRYLLVGRELDNFTYDIANLDELATFIAEAVSSTKERARAAIDELEGDTRFRERLEELLRPRTDRERKARYGRRA